DAGGVGDRLRPEVGGEDRRRLLWQRVDPGVLDRVVAAVVALEAALPQQADHLHGLLEHLQPYVGLGPHGAEDVLVERLAATDAEGEAAGQERRRCRGGL